MSLYGVLNIPKNDVILTIATNAFVINRQAYVCFQSSICYSASNTEEDVAFVFWRQCVDTCVLFCSVF